MTIHLPESLESSILEAVHSGKFASLDDAMTTAARLLLEKLQQGQAEAKEPAVSEEAAASAPKPIWEVAAEIRRSVPKEEWAKVPPDGAAQHRPLPFNGSTGG